jgi:hypothetical protein
MANEPAAAANMLDEAIAEWRDHHFQMQHVFHLIGVCQSDLYARQPNPYARVITAWPTLSNAYLLRMPMLAHTLRHLRGRTAIAQARSDRADRELLLRDAADCGVKLCNARAPFAVGWGFALRAGVDATRADRERAVQRLEQAEAAFYESEMTLYAAATRFQIGRLLGGERGRELNERATEWFEAQDVRNPEAFIATLLPGFD